MQLSDNGTELLKKYEALSLKPYKDAGGKWTIGYGHLITKEEQIGGKYQDPITEIDALALFHADLKPFEAAVGNMVTVPLSQNQFDALVIFAFNVGTGGFQHSTLLKMLNAGDYDAVPDQLARWNRVNGQVCAGLTNRRSREIALWEATA